MAERQSGETVTGTEFQSKNMVPGGKDLKSNFIRTIRADLTKAADSAAEAISYQITHVEP